MAEPRKSEPAAGGRLHPRNPLGGRYDFDALCQSCADLEEYLRPNPLGDRTIEFTDPEAVLCLNRALLAHHYGVRDWQIPAGYLCPPIPGRADYIHYLADLLGGGDGKVPEGLCVRVLDIGTGANCVYPLIGNRSYGWTFVGTDVDLVAIGVAGEILSANPEVAGAVSLVVQAAPGSIFRGVIGEGDRFDLTMCNPPFFASAEDAQQSNQRKVENLSKGKGRSPRGGRNFGGQPAELWCPGGELRFLKQMILESAEFAGQVTWFTSLVSKREHLRTLKRRLSQSGARRVEIVEMAQGQKQSRFIAWSFC